MEEQVSDAMINAVVHNIALRAAVGDDVVFALHMTEACMRVYAEQTWGSWDGCANLNLAFDEIIQLAGRDIGITGSIAAVPRQALPVAKVNPARLRATARSGVRLPGENFVKTLEQWVERRAVDQLHLRVPQLIHALRTSRLRLNSTQ